MRFSASGTPRAASERARHGTQDIVQIRHLRRPDLEHPLGYGRELYFWSFIVALLIFALGAGVSLYEGVQHVRNPEPIVDPHISYLVLALAFLFEGGSWLVSWRQWRAPLKKSMES